MTTKYKRNIKLAIFIFIVFLGILFILFRSQESNLNTYFEKNDPSMSGAYNEPEIPSAENYSNIEYFEKAKTEKSYLFCEKIDINLEKNLCIKNIAILESDKSLCLKIDNVDILENCLYQVSLVIVSEDDKYTTCVDLKNQELRKNCFITYMRVNNDILDCDDFNGDFKVYCKDQLNFDYAINNDNPKICLDILSPEDRGECFSSIFSAKDNNNFCQIYDDVIKDECLGYIKQY